MGLLDKTNPKATRQSVTRNALGFGTGSAILYLVVCLWRFDAYHWWQWLVAFPGVVLFSAFIGGLMEWQLNDSVDEPSDLIPPNEGGPKS